MNTWIRRCVPAIAFVMVADLASAQQPGTIAVVQTWGELAAQPALTLKNGNKVRVGLEQREATRNGAFIIYALVEGAKWQTQGSNVLGPVHVEISPDHRTHKQSNEQLHEHAMEERDTKQMLFMNVMPVSIAGQYTLVLRGPDDVIVAKGLVTVADRPSEPWLAFGHPEELRLQEADRDGIVRDINIAVNKSVPALPACDGRFPVMAWPNGGKQLPPNEALPRWAFVKADPRLKLEADLKSLRVEAAKEMDLDNPRLHWLFRVWVNGKLFAPESQEQIWTKTALRVVLAKKLHLDWKLDPKQISARQGEQIAVQLLYCPDGWQMSATKHLGWTNRSEKVWRTDQPRLPLLTNKVEFICP